MICRRRGRQLMGTVLAAVMTVMQMTPAMAGMPVKPAGSGQGTQYETDIYKVFIDSEAGGATELTDKDGKTWNDLKQDKIPGQTILDTGLAVQGEIKEKTKTVYHGTAYGAEGVYLEGEVSGKKSYFMFPDEILCLGAGIENTSQTQGEDPVITVVENKPIGRYTYLGLPKPSPTFKPVMADSNVGTTALNAAWEPLKDTPTKADHPRKWLYVSEGSGVASNVQYGFIFPKGLDKSGVSYKIKSTGGTAPYHFELWTEDPAYEYLIVPRPGVTNLGSYQEKTVKVVNTPKAQAAYHAASGLFAANLWEASSFDASAAGLGTVCSTHPMSFMIKQQMDGQDLTVFADITVPEDSTGLMILELGIPGTSAEAPSGVRTEFKGDSTSIIIDGDVLKGQTVPVVIHQQVTETVFANDAYTMHLELNPQVHLGRTWLDNDHESDYYITDYWSAINKNRIPGTTVLGNNEKALALDPLTIPENTTTTSDWRGGSTRLDQAGVLGIQMEGGDVSGYKSWFLMDNQIVCLGAGLHNTSSDNPDADVITVLDNVKLRKDLSNYITIDYKTIRASEWIGSGSDKRLEDEIYNKANGGYKTDHTWTFIKQSNTEKAGIGYYFPKSAGGEAQYRFSKNQDTEGGERIWYELWLNHGASENASYEYVILPEVENQGAVYEYYTSPENVTLANTEKIQAVYNKKSRTMGANFWTSEGGSIKSSLCSNISADGKVSVLMNEAGGKLKLAVSDPSRSQETIRLEVERKGFETVSCSPELTVDLSAEDKIVITGDLSKKTGESFQAEINAAPPVSDDGEVFDITVGERITLPVPDEMKTSAVTWSCAFLKDDKTTVNNAGYSKFKRELKGDEKEGVRRAGPTSVSHLAEVEGLENKNGLVTGRGMGTVSVIAEDDTGQKKIWQVRVHALSKKELPEASDQDYEAVRSRYRETLIGSDTESAGKDEWISSLDEAAARLWDSYAYKGQSQCDSKPWPDQTDENGGPGNPDLPFEDDAVEFRPIVQNLLVMAKAYKTVGSSFYQNQDIKNDMINILHWFSSECYGPKTQTDNWWTWEIGIPKDLVPVLILLYDDLTQEQRKEYSRGILFFQPDPYHEGVTGFATTHAQGYRKNEGANLLDCSVIAMGLGAVLNDNELITLAREASSSQFVIHEVKDSKKLSLTGYDSGFYDDGSYLDHSYVPYTGSYGIEFFRGGVNLSTMLHNTPWEYPQETMEVLKHYVTEGFGASIYRGMMLDSLKGRAVSRKESTNRASGRDVMGLILRLTEVMDEAFADEFKQMVKSWMTADTGYLDSLKGAENEKVQKLAEEIWQDESISSKVLPLHKNMTYMDRSIHRTNDWLSNLSMYSSRIQNCEIMNGENLYGWHQGDGALYLYDEEDDRYNDQYWNTVNPMRMPGTTVVPVPIGNGTKDGSGLYQDGDYRSHEDWVGGSEIGNSGINGMAVSGENTSSKVTYAPGFKAFKSWFFFDKEIVCLGAGITNSSDDHSTETVIENKKLSEAGDEVLTVNGRPTELKLTEASVKRLAEGTEDTSGTAMEFVSFAHLEANGQGKGTGYYFPDSDQKIHVRKARNTGDWSNIGTTRGEAARNYLEMWYDHGKNPKEAAYEYVLLPNTDADTTEDYAYHPEVTVLANTSKVQAVYNRIQQITGANFWTDTKQSAGIITADKKASVMLEENEMEGTLTLAVSDPTMKNSKQINVWVDRPVTEVISHDDNVKIEETKTGFKCTVSTEGTNGKSSYAVLQMKAAIMPGAITIKKGGSVQFTAYDYENQEGEFIWSLKGAAPLAAGTRLEEGLLKVSSQETNGLLTVQAVSASDPELILKAPVTVSGNIAEEVTNEIEEIENAINDLVNKASPSDATDPRVQQKVYSTVASLATASNAKLAGSGTVMEHLGDLEQLYIDVAEESGGITIGARVKNPKADPEITQCDIRITGAALSIPPRIAKATDSNAVMSFETTNGAGKDKNTKNKMDWDTAFWLDIWLDILDGEDKPIKGLAKIQPSTPIILDIALPEGLDEEKDIYWIHYERDGSISEVTKLEPENHRVRAVITGLSAYALVNGKITDDGRDEDPDNPKDPDEKPEDEKKPEDEAQHRTSSGGDSNQDQGIKGKWILDQNGWWYQYKNGTWPSDCWQKIDGVWYYFNKDGYMATGWLLVKDRWYYLNPDGAMLANEWINHKNKWYYLGADGSMAMGQWIFYETDGGYYYLNGSTGEMETDQKTPDGFYVGTDGRYVKE